MALCSIRPHPARPGAMEAEPSAGARPPVRPCLHPCACALYPPKGQSRRPRRRRRRPEWIFFKMSLLLRACASVRGRACIDPAAAAAPCACVRARACSLSSRSWHETCAPPMPFVALVEGPPEGKQLLFSPSSSLSSSVPLLASFPSPFALYDLHAGLVSAPAMTIGSAAAAAAAAQLNPSCI